jgi:hypothetical protein
LVIVDRDHLKELYRATDEELSFAQATRQALQTDYTLHPEVPQIRFHIKAVKEVMSRQVPNSMTDIVEEIQLAFDDEMDVGEGKISPLVWLIYVRLDTCYPVSQSAKDHRKNE